MGRGGNSRGRSGSRKPKWKADNAGSASSWDGEWTWTAAGGWKPGPTVPATSTPATESSGDGDRQERRRLQGLQQALRLASQHAGVASAQAEAIRQDLDMNWEALRSSMDPQQQIDSLTTEVTRIEERAATVTSRLQEIAKEKAEHEAELTILARRAVVFRQKREAVQAALDLQAKVTVVDDNDLRLQQTNQQLAGMQAALTGLMQALSVSAPAVIQQLPPALVAELNTVAQRQVGLQSAAAPVAQQPVQQQAPLAGPPPQPGVGIAVPEPAPLATRAAVSMAPTPSRSAIATSSRALAGGAGRSTKKPSEGPQGKTLGVKKSSIKAAMTLSDSSVRTAAPAIGAGAPCMETDSDVDSEVDDAAVQAQLAMFAAAAAAQPAAAAVAEQITPQAAPLQAPGDGSLVPPGPT